MNSEPYLDSDSARSSVWQYAAAAVHKAIARAGDSAERSEAAIPDGANRPRRARGRWRESIIHKSGFERMVPNIFRGMQELPWTCVQSSVFGLSVSRAVYQGCRRNGPSYIDTWIKENNCILSENGRLVVECLKYYGCRFTTYDDVLDYLKDHNWGELKIDRGEENVMPTTTEEKLIRQKIIDLSIKKAVATKKERIETLMDQFTDRKDFSKIAIAEQAIKSFGVSRGTAKEYSEIVYYNLLPIRTKKIADSNVRNALELKHQQATDEQSQIAAMNHVYRQRESLKEQIETLRHAVRNFPGRFETQLEQKEVELARLEDDLHAKG